MLESGPCPYDCEEGVIYASPDDDISLMAGLAIGESYSEPCPNADCGT